MTEQERMYRDHGTPAEFACAVWHACYQLFITVDEAEAAVAKYEREWAAAATVAA